MNPTIRQSDNQAILHGTIRILIADDHKMVRAGLVSLLETEDDFRVVGQAGDGREAVELALRLRPDVVIMDLMMPVLDGVCATGEIRRQLPATQVLVITTYISADDVGRAVENGAAGVLSKGADGDELTAAIRRVHAGEKVIPGAIRRQIRERPPLPDLTDRQREILLSMARGLTNPDIALQFGIGVDRVKEHVNAILAKIGAGNRTEAVAIALRRHLLKI